MATYTEQTLQLTYASSSFGYGAIMKTIVEKLCEMCPEIEVESVRTNTNAAYCAYLRVLGCDNLVLKLGAESDADLEFGVNYNNDTYDSIVNYGSSLELSSSSNYTYTIKTIYHPGVFITARIQLSGGCYELSAWKMVDICSGETLTTVGCGTANNSYADLMSSTMYAARDGVHFVVNMAQTISNATDNGFTRMHPVYCYGSKFLGTLTDANVIYTGYTGGKVMSLAPFTEFSVGGTSFISLGVYAARIE